MLRTHSIKHSFEFPLHFLVIHTLPDHNTSYLVTPFFSDLTDVENVLSGKAAVSVITATISTSALGIAGTAIPLASKIILVRQRSFSNGAVIPYNNGSTWALKCYYVTDWSPIANTNVIVDIYTIS